MRNLTDHLSKYATYHRDRRNIATHFVGIPVIVVATAALFARLSVSVGGFPISLATLVALGSILFYFKLDVRFGLVMTLFMSASVWLGTYAAAQSTAVWLSLSVLPFVLGWLVQFV